MSADALFNALSNTLAKTKPVRETLTDGKKAALVDALGDMLAEKEADKQSNTMVEV